jgi:hypothetical protein
MDDVSPVQRTNIEAFSFFHRLSTGAKKPPKQTITEREECSECCGAGFVSSVTTIRHQHPADEWTIPSLLPISLNGSFT